MGQIPRTRDDIRLHKHTGIYDGGPLDARALSHISITTFADGSDIAHLSADQTFTGQNTFDGPTIFNGTVSISSLSVSGSLLVPDDAFRITGSADPSKLLAFEVDGFTTATTRTLTPQDRSGTLALLEGPQTFNSDHTFTSGTITIDSTAQFTTTPTAGALLPAFVSITVPNKAVMLFADAVTGSTGTTVLAGLTANRSWTWQDSSYTVAGLEVADQTWTGINRFGSGDILLRADGTSDFLGLMDVQSIRVSDSVKLRSTFGIETSIRNASGGASHTIDWPSSQGAANTLLRNDGAGALTWVTTASVIDVARTWTTLQTFPDNTLKVVGSADASKTLVFELDGAAVGADLTLSWAGTADRIVTFPDGTTTLPGLSMQNTWTRGNVFQTTLGSEQSVLIKESSGGSVNVFAIQDALANNLVTVDNQGGTTLTNYGGGSALVLVDSVDGSDLSFGLSGVGAGGTLTFPPGGGLMVTAASTTIFTNKRLTTACYANCGVASTNLRFANGTSTSQYVNVDLTALTSARLQSWQNYAGRVPIVGDDAPAVATNSLGQVDLITQTANIVTTNLSNVPATGIYIIEAILMTTTAAAAGGTLALTVGWTDNAGATTTNVIAAHSLVTAGRSSGRQMLRVSSGEITYAVTVTGIYSTAVYAVYVRVISLG